MTAVCHYCRRPMDGSGCTLDTAAPWGSERPDRDALNRAAPCPDCGVLPGGLHHILCDVPECLACGQQRLEHDCEATK